MRWPPFLNWFRRRRSQPTRPLGIRETEQPRRSVRSDGILLARLRYGEVYVSPDSRETWRAISDRKGSSPRETSEYPGPGGEQID